MKNRKQPLIFIAFIVVGILLFFLGFGRYALASMPFQDPEYVPASALAKQANDILVGKIMMLIGVAMGFGAVIVRIKNRP